MFRFKSKIAHRLFLALVLIAVIPIIITGYENYSAARKALTQTALMHLATIAGDHANHLNAWFQERVHDVEILSRLPAIAEICKKHCLAVGAYEPLPQDVALLNYTIGLTQGRSAAYKSIHIVAPSGAVLASTDPGSSDLLHFKQLPVYKKLQASDGPALGPIYQAKDGSWRMNLATKVVDRDGQTTAYILVVLDVSKTLDPLFADHIGLGKTGEVYLVDRDGQFITRSRFLGRSETAHKRYESYGIRAGLDHETGSAIYKNYLGREVVGSYIWLPRFDWVIVAEMGKSEILAPLRRIAVMVMGTSLGVGLLCLLMAFIVSRRVSQPIIRVAEAAKEFAEGRLDRRISFSSPDEVGVLAQSFNTMSEQLSKLITSLQEKEESLQTTCHNLVVTQKQLLQSEKMAAIGELTASVVHEMRNPLSSVKLNLQIIGRYLAANPPLSEHYQIALEQVAHLEKMFSDLLDYSKPYEIHKAKMDLLPIIDRSLQQLVAVIIGQNVSITKSISEPDIPVAGDPDKIEQAVVNVLKNGIEAAGANGNIDVSARTVRSNGTSVVEIAVSDNGPGIPPQQMKRIFQPFFTTKEKGTGLGLSIVRKIIDAHHGDISVSSESGKGTVVRLSLPLE
jgi:signal transduction histidine kinase